MIIKLLLFLFLYMSPVKESVYICSPSGAKKYHFLETCRGLSNCKQGVVKTTLNEAQLLGLTLCGWED